MAQGASDLARELVQRQNTDGGWGYQGVTSWTEPTALAVLALESLMSEPQSRARGVAWLFAHQRADGGWASNPAVNKSTSVTSPACLAISGQGNPDRHDNALRWIIGQAKPDLNLLARIELRLEGMPPSETVMGGSPWYPGTASWIAPTALSVLAGTDALRWQPSTPTQHHIERGQDYIISRQCPGGGWNHGGSQFRSPEAKPYPEMTGLALLALEKTHAQQCPDSLRLAERMQFHAESSEGQSWLEMALRKHGRTPASVPPISPRTTRDLTLRLLAMSATSPSNKLLQLCA